MINFLGDLSRRHDHLKVKGVEGKKARYERAIMLYKPSILGRSFWVPDSCGWKYLEPKDNGDMIDTDLSAFEEIVKHHEQQILLNPRYNPSYEAEALHLGARMHTNSGFMLMTGYSLVRCCQLLDITITPPALAQLLMFIQDGLQELRTMPMPVKDAEMEIGEMDVVLERDGVTKKWTDPLTVTEGELKTGILGG